MITNSTPPPRVRSVDDGMQPFLWLSPCWGFREGISPGLGITLGNTSLEELYQLRQRQSTGLGLSVTPALISLTTAGEGPTLLVPGCQGASGGLCPPFRPVWRAEGMWLRSLCSWCSFLWFYGFIVPGRAVERG